MGADAEREGGVSEMVERVARVLQGFDESFSPDEALDPCYVREAREVIAAMREPTDAMVEAGMDATAWPICNGEVEHRFQAMIDAALK